MRVLVVEDETTLADVIAERLRRESFGVDVAYDGEAALQKANMNEYDVVVLDRDLPLVHGDDVCRALVAARAPARILMLTAAAAIPARVEGLALGADDYLTKPFALLELAARVHALGRRATRPTPPIRERSGVLLDPGRRLVSRDGIPIVLSTREFGVLDELLRADGGVVSAEYLLEKVWDENIDPFSNAVRVAVMRLRRKLGDPPLIDTVPDLGYRLR